jgi:dTDP-4-amino-4,6-dideoxygalactose transaminase
LIVLVVGVTRRTLLLRGGRIIKTIESASDLAINGATPAFAEPLHVGRPSMGDRELFDQYVDRLYESRWLTNNGPLVAELEEKIAEYHQVKHCVAMCNGTIALEISIRALGLKGEVIVPSFTFVATAHALSWQGIKPVFADIDPVTHNLDPGSVEKMITPATSGVIGVHLWGRPAPVEELQSLAEANDLKLMFDAAHAFGCSRNGVSIGNFGECEVMSFHATKFFNSFEGGAVLTSNDELAEKMRLMRNFGFAGNDNVIHPGTNGKMTEICAAMGLSNLDALDSLLQKNRENYEIYHSRLKDIDGVKILENSGDANSNYQYIVINLSEDFPTTRDQLVDALHAENILARKYFWPGCHMMTPYKETQPHASLLLKNTNKVAEKVIVLPTGISMGVEEIDTLCRVIRVLSNFD